jgi:hypothetical protein
MHTERKALNVLAREEQVNTSCTSGLNMYQLNVYAVPGTGTGNGGTVHI